MLGECLAQENLQTQGNCMLVEEWELDETLVMVAACPLDADESVLCTECIACLEKNCSNLLWTSCTSAFSLLTPHKATTHSLTMLCEGKFGEMGMYAAKMVWCEFFVLTAGLTGKPATLILPLSEVGESPWKSWLGEFPSVGESNGEKGPGSGECWFSSF